MSSPRPSITRTSTHLLAALSVVVTISCGIPLSAQDAPLDFDTLFAPGAHGRVPSSFAWAPDGARLAFFFEDDDGKALWLATDKKVELLRRAGSGEKLDAFHWSPDGKSLLLESAGDLLLLDLARGEARRLTETVAAEKDPKFSPAGNRVAFVRDADLWLIDLATGTERRLTEDGSDVILNGTTDWVYWEEIWGRDATGHWWSPGGDRIAFYRFDDSEVGLYTLLPYGDSASEERGSYARVKSQRYPKAGTTNPTVTIGILDLDGTETIWLDTEADEETYLARVDWVPDGSSVAVQRLNREQDRIDILRCSPASGQCSTLHNETSETWVNVTNDLKFLSDGSFLWSTEKSGRRALELRAADGSLVRDLAVDGWTVDHVDAVVESTGSVVWTGYPSYGLGARHRVAVRQSIADGSFRGVTDPERWSSVTVSPVSGMMAVIASSANDPAQAAITDSDGATVTVLPVSEPVYDPAATPQWKFLTIPGPAGVELPAALLVPPGLDPVNRNAATTYPAIMYHYGGPASQVVSDVWSRRARNPWHKLMAMRGYVVLMVDNEASNYFGKAGADLLHRRFGPRNLAAQLAGVEYLRSTGFVDTERIGIWGWSGGGANTLYSVFNSPGTWRAAVSGAPVTNWDFYDTIWTERYLDHPEDNPDGYRDSSATTYVNELEDALLVVHGTADDNVHPQNTLVLSELLIAAGKSFEQAIYPGQKHGFRGDSVKHFYLRMTEFFDRHLQ